MIPLSKNDAREVRNFKRFIKLWPKFKEEMLKRPKWRKYLGLTDSYAECTLDMMQTVDNVQRTLRNKYDD